MHSGLLALRNLPRRTRYQGRRPEGQGIALVRHLSFFFLDEAPTRSGLVAKPFNRNARGEACEGSRPRTQTNFTIVRMQSNVRKSAHNRPDCLPTDHTNWSAHCSASAGGGPRFPWKGEQRLWSSHESNIRATTPMWLNNLAIIGRSTGSRQQSGTALPSSTRGPASRIRSRELKKIATKHNTRMAVTFYTVFYLTAARLFCQVNAPLYKAPSPRRTSPPSLRPNQ